MKNPRSSFYHRERRRRTRNHTARAVDMLARNGWPRDQARKNVDNTSPCACWMCNRRRERDGLTYSEKRSLLAFQDDD